MYGYNIFHEEILNNLLSLVKSGQNNHAYLFVGEAGLGKHEAAQLFANALVCESLDVVPCTVCPSCVQAKAKTNPDIIYVSKNDDKKTKGIGVDDIRKVNKGVFEKPFECKKKVYIIEDGELMSEEAQNAFLKTLEEPPEYAVFIIVSTTDNFLPTVLSRCTMIKFPRVSNAVLYEYAKKNYPDQNVDFLVSFSQGNPRVIDRYVNDTEFVNRRNNSVKKIRQILSHSYQSVYEIIEFLEVNKENVFEILDFWLVIARDILFVSCGLSKRVVNNDIMEFLDNESITHTEAYLSNAVEVLEKAHEMSKRSVNIRAMAFYIILKIKRFKG